MEHPRLRKCRSAMVLFPRPSRGNSVATIPQSRSGTMKRLLTKDSCGSMMSIYDDQLSLSSLEDESSDSSLEPIPASPLELPPNTPPVNNGVSDLANSMCIIVEDEELSRHTWYAGKLSRLEAEHCLADMRDGTYLVRESEGPCSSYTHAIAIMNREQPSHIRIFHSNGQFSLTGCDQQGTACTFSSLEELVGYFQEHSLGCSFPSIDTPLKFPFKDREEIEPMSPDYNEQLPVYDDPHEPPELPARPSLIDTYLPLTQQSWYHGRLSRRLAENILSTKPNFSFLVRDSESIPDGFSLSIKDVTSGYIHLKIECHTAGYILGQNSRPFRTVAGCIEYYCRERLRVRGATQRPLHSPVARS